ncbi:cystathionine gamma-synthase [Colletotrichum asianum]|uniref:cystathionine gamma-synthase n=1 Tax=Colletotrichum asianum TaxID=702518 RepID=A0A8H3ZKV3_9PEZI|nr:cystathionine gamma-synthase [Colletotrichum asianum]
MLTGYPRFFIHRSIESLAQTVASSFSHTPGQRAMLFPNEYAAQLCVGFLHAHAPAPALVGIETVALVVDDSNPDAVYWKPLSPSISAVICHPDTFKYAKQFWQHGGLGVSSRRAEFCHCLLQQALLVPEHRAQSTKQMNSHGPPLYHPPELKKEILSSSESRTTEALRSIMRQEPTPCAKKGFGQEVEILLSGSRKAKKVLQQRIASMLRPHLNAHAESGTPIEIGPRSSSTYDLTDDVYIFPTGMSAIFHTHQFLLGIRGNMKSISFGFPYVDTLKILEKFGPGCVFYGNATEVELDDIQHRLERGERYLALFCEFPGNPLLTCPNLKRIRSLADKYDFAIVVDETIGTFANVNFLQYADVVVTSLTKFFSGACNVTGGSAVFNPTGRYYSSLKAIAERDYKDTYWPEDVILMERNSRDFTTRIRQMNINAEAVAKLLLASPLIKRVHYPKYNGDKSNYKACRMPGGGYGGLMSVMFHHKQDAITFYDNMNGAKGPSLGTNFTLTSPYVILAHMKELEWASSLGVDPYLVRFSVGMEDTDQLLEIFRRALCSATGPRKSCNMVNFMSHSGAE